MAASGESYLTSFMSALTRRSSNTPQQQTTVSRPSDDIGNSDEALVAESGGGDLEAQKQQPKTEAIVEIDIEDTQDYAREQERIRFADEIWKQAMTEKQGTLSHDDPILGEVLKTLNGQCDYKSVVSCYLLHGIFTAKTRTVFTFYIPEKNIIYKILSRTTAFTANKDSLFFKMDAHDFISYYKTIKKSKLAKLTDPDGGIRKEDLYWWLQKRIKLLKTVYRSVCEYIHIPSLESLKKTGDEIVSTSSFNEEILSDVILVNRKPFQPDNPEKLGTFRVTRENRICTLYTELANSEEEVLQVFAFDEKQYVEMTPILFCSLYCLLYVIDAERNS
jgi:hypothetical protein